MRDLRLIDVNSDATTPAQVTRILVVEDDETDFYVVSRFLKKALQTHYQLTHVQNHECAIQELEKNKFDAVLLDYHLPGDSPDEIVTMLDGGWDVPFIVLTGNNSKNIEQIMLSAGALSFLHKNGLCEDSLSLSISAAIRRFAVEKEERIKRETLRRNWRNAEAANFSKSEFLAFLGDEVKTPLNAIVGFSKALEEISAAEGLPEKFQMYSNMINDSSSHLTALIDDLLELSQTQSSDFDPRGDRFKRYRTWILDKQKAQPNDKAIYEQAMLAKRA